MTPTSVPAQTSRLVRQRRALGFVFVLVGVAVLSGCGSARTSATSSGVLRFTANVTAGQRSAATTALRARLRRLGLSSTTQRMAAQSIKLKPAPNAAVTEALARKSRTRIVEIIDSHLGPCTNGGTSGARAAARCFTLGRTIADTDAITATQVRAQQIDGYGVDVTIDANRFRKWRDAIAPYLNRTVAIVAGDQVLADVRVSVPGLEGRIAGQLLRSEAQRVAAALLVQNDLPFELSAQEPRVSDGASTQDAWMASLSVRVCGKWIVNAPAFMSEVGLHSHNDGLIYVHSLPASQQGQPLTLGAFLKAGGWQVTKHRLQLWDGVDVRAGDRCESQTGTSLRWSVDGVENSGDPAQLALRPNQIIVLDFGSTAGPVPPPPSISELLRTYWGPRLERKAP